jgi:hypothetical protein
MLFNRYVDDLRDYYFKVFSKQIYDSVSKAGPIDEETLAGERVRVITEARAAMTSARPSSCQSWSFEGALSELEADTLALADELKAKRVLAASQITGGTLDSFVNSDESAADVDEDDDDDDDNDKEKDSKNRNKLKSMLLRVYKKLNKRARKLRKFSWKKGLKKKLKWLLAQTAILAFNFCQNELHRRSAIRSSERRLAEVPGFPLL